jgi:hypothetical protein
MTNQHPITPPQELRNKWIDEAPSTSRCNYLIDNAAQWGADQELEACVEWFQKFYRTESWVTHDLKHFRTARRPKPPSLKEQAIRELGGAYDRDKIDDTTYDTIRRALEALP